MQGEAKRPHTHDVRALAVGACSGSEPVLVSAGVDAQLLAHSVPRFAQALLSFFHSHLPPPCTPYQLPGL